MSTITYRRTARRASRAPMTYEQLPLFRSYGHGFALLRMMPMAEATAAAVAELARQRNTPHSTPWTAGSVAQMFRQMTLHGYPLTRSSDGVWRLLRAPDAETAQAMFDCLALAYAEPSGQRL
jgi:hypothetical protein